MQVCIADFAGVCISSVCRIVKRVSEAIGRRADNYITMPRNETEMRAAAAAFYAIAKFPRTIGAIDCTHIKIQSPGGDNAEVYRNRKTWFSINVQTVAAADLKILDIVTRWPGVTHDQSIFNASSLKMRLERGDFGHYIIAADSGYTNTMYMATPFLDLENDPAKNLFNESQIRTRNVVERSYGVLKRRFPVLATGLRIRLDGVEAVIVACAVLHNICLDARDVLPPVELELEGFNEAMEMQRELDANVLENLLQARVATENQSARRRRKRQDITIRDILVENYFRPMLLGRMHDDDIDIE